MNEQLVLLAVNTFLSERIEKDKKKYKDEITPEQVEQIENKYSIQNWMNTVAEAADQVSLNVSHVSKLTHSSSKANNVTDVIEQESLMHLITTQTICAKERDLAYSNALHSPIAEFLSVEVEGHSQILGELLAENTENLRLLSQNDVEISYWFEKIREAFKPAKIKSHVLAKQVYLPVGKNSEGEELYHLISPVESSSLAQKVFVKVKESRDAQTPVNIARKNKEWSEETYCYFRDLARISVTKSNHQNASKLNGARSGGLYLFLSEPRTWENKVSISNGLMINSTSQFLAECYSSTMKSLIHDLNKYLLILEKKQLKLNHQQQKVFVEKLRNIALEVIEIIQMLQIYSLEKDIASEDLPEYLRTLLTPHLIDRDKLELTKEQRVDEFTDQITVWLSTKTGNKERIARYEKLWFKIMRPIFRDFDARMAVNYE